MNNVLSVRGQGADSGVLMSAIRDARNSGNVGEVERAMRIAVQYFEVQQSPLVYWTALYLRVTREIRDALETGFFRDPNTVSQIVARFGYIYFEALEQYLKGERVEGLWHLHFDASIQRATLTQHLLVPICIHVVNDLPVVLASVCGLKKLDAFAEDFDRLNRLFFAVYRAASQSIASTLPMGQKLYRPLSSYVERVVRHLFEASRHMAFHDARRLCGAQTTRHFIDACAVIARKARRLSLAIAQPPIGIGRALSLASSLECGTLNERVLLMCA